MAINFYNDQAQIFTKSTLLVDMKLLYDQFLPNIPDDGRILDAGCGSGRDSRFFLQQGYVVDAFDASEKMVDIASDIIGQTVHHATFHNYQSPYQFEGIWACASLLHLSKNELSSALLHLWSFLKPNGIFYLSFKYGTEERQVGGRHFTDMNEESTGKLISQLPNVAKYRIWLTDDQRPDRQEQWLNGLIWRNP